MAPWVYVNPRLAKAAGKTPAEVARSLADYLAKQPEVFRVFTREDLAREFPGDQPTADGSEVMPTDFILDLLPEWPDGASSGS